MSSIRRQRLYAGVGALLALGAPAGLVLVRSARAGLLSPAWLQRELQGDLATYAYVFFSTLTVFSLYGFVLGRHADRLVEASATDSLTGLPNRRAFHGRLVEEYARARRYGGTLSLLLLDLDRLKEINDRDGHRAGDTALQRVAAALRTGLRATDVGARWGGDEFAFLAPNTGREAALQLAERIHREVLGEDSAVTVSVGVATVAPGATPEDAEALVRAADDALYQAKREGRNRILGSA